MTSVWQPLDHATVLRGVEATLGQKLSNLFLQRNSYINRVFELEKDKDRERLIVKFYRPGRWSREMILEEHNFLADLADKELPVIAPIKFNENTLFELNSILYEIMPKKGGRPFDEFDKSAWEELGRLLARIHLVGALHTKAKRLIWRPAVATREHLKTLAGNDYLLPDFRPGFLEIAERFVNNADVIFDGHEQILLHGDCHKGNLLLRPGEGIHIVDFDDICLGPPVQDLWMLLPDEPEKCPQEMEWFLKGYETFRPFDINSLKLIPALRAMRIIHYAAWLSIQSGEPDFNTHFPHAGSKRYWSELIRDLQEIVLSYW